jgi:hypothetical protein
MRKERKWIAENDTNNAVQKPILTFPPGNKR